MEPKKHYFAHIPTIAIFIAFAISGPLGLLLFILKSIDKKSEKEEQARNGWGTASRPLPAPLRIVRPFMVPTSPPGNSKTPRSATIS